MRRARKLDTQEVFKMGTVLFLWLAGMVVALVCGWMLVSDFVGGRLPLSYTTISIFLLSCVLIFLASVIKNPTLVSWGGAIAIVITIIIGITIIVYGAFMAHKAFKGEAPLLVAIVIIVIGMVMTYPGAAYALFSLTAGGC